MGALERNILRAICGPLRVVLLKYLDPYLSYRIYKQTDGQLEITKRISRSMIVYMPITILIILYRYIQSLV